MTGPPPTKDKDTPAEAIEEVVALLREAGQAKRDLGERELVREFSRRFVDSLREGSA